MMKVVLVGNINVGKSSLFVRFKEGRFVDKLNSTIGLDQVTKEIPIKDSEKKAKINLWDTAGLEVAGYMTSNYYRMSKGVILMYDVTQRDSLNSLRMWMDDAKPYIDPKTTFFLVGNKIDSSSSEIDVKKEDAWNFAENKQIPKENVFEISVKTGKGLEEFMSSAATILNHIEYPSPQTHVIIHSSTDEKKRCC